jgi:hypothetical protein
MAFTCVHSEGGLIPADLLEEIAAGETRGQSAVDFGLPRGARLTDEIAAVWADARAYWEAFQRGLRCGPEDDPATTGTREQWGLPLLRAPGYGDITFTPRAAVLSAELDAYCAHLYGPDYAGLEGEGDQVVRGLPHPPAAAGGVGAVEPLKH